MAKVGECMVWAIVDKTGMPMTETFANHHDEAWHRFIQENGAVDREDAVTMVLQALRSGLTCECLSVRFGHSHLHSVAA